MFGGLEIVSSSLGWGHKHSIEGAGDAEKVKMQYRGSGVHYGAHLLP